MARTGANAYFKWNTESAFGGGNASKTKALGYDVRIGGWRISNEQMAIPGLNNLEIVNFAYGRNQGAFSGDWWVSNPWFLLPLFGAETDSGGAAPYTHAFSLPAAKTVQTMTAEVGFQGETANVQRTILGLILNSVSFSSSIGSALRARGDFIYGIKDTVGSTLDASPPVDDQSVPYTFAQGSLQLPNATTIAQLDSVDLTISQNAELIWGHNSADAVGAMRKQMTYNARFKSTMFDASLINDVINRATVATMTLLFTQGAGATLKSIEFDATVVGVSEHSTDIEPVARVFDNLVFQIQSMTVTAKNPSVSPP